MTENATPIGTLDRLPAYKRRSNPIAKAVVMWAPMLAQIDAVARRWDLTRAETMRHLIRTGLQLIHEGYRTEHGSRMPKTRRKGLREDVGVAMDQSLQDAITEVVEEPALPYELEGEVIREALALALAQTGVPIPMTS